MNRLIFLSQKRFKQKYKVIVEENDEKTQLPKLFSNLLNINCQLSDNQSQSIIICLQELTQLEQETYQSISVFDLQQLYHYISTNKEIGEQNDILIYELFLEILYKIFVSSNDTINEIYAHDIYSLLESLNLKNQQIINKYNVISDNIIIISCKLFQIIGYNKSTYNGEYQFKIFDFIYQMVTQFTNNIDINEANNFEQILNSIIDIEILMLQRHNVKALNAEHLTKYQQIYDSIACRTDDIICKYLSFLLSLTQMQNDIDKCRGQQILQCMLNNCYTQISYINISYQVLETICMLIVELRAIISDFIVDKHASLLFRKIVQKLLKKYKYYNISPLTKKSECFALLCSINAEIQCI